MNKIMPKLIDLAGAVIGDQRVDDRGTALLQSSQCRGFILLHEPAVADYVSDEDRSKMALDALFGHIGFRQMSQGILIDIAVDGESR